MTGNDAFDAILKEVQFWTAIYELDRYGGKITNAEYDVEIDKLVNWAQACIDEEKGRALDAPAREPIPRTYQEVLAATVTL